MRHKKAWPWLIISVLIVLLDQASKYLVSHHFVAGVPFYLMRFLNFTLSYNTGAAFSFFNSGGWLTYGLISFSLIVSIIVFIWLLQLDRQQKWLAFSLSLILGGAVGNLIDRIRQHYVVDFIDFHIHAWHFAIFNVADSAVTIGVTILLIKWIFFADKR